MFPFIPVSEPFNVENSCRLCKKVVNEEGAGEGERGHRAAGPAASAGPVHGMFKGGPGRRAGKRFQGIGQTTKNTVPKIR